MYTHPPRAEWKHALSLTSRPGGKRTSISNSKRLLNRKQRLPCLRLLRRYGRYSDAFRFKQHRPPDERLCEYRGATDEGPPRCTHLAMRFRHLARDRQSHATYALAVLEARRHHTKRKAFRAVPTWPKVGVWSGNPHCPIGPHGEPGPVLRLLHEPSGDGVHRHIRDLVDNVLVVGQLNGTARLCRP